VINKDIFCNTPWYELHIYWDGSLGICCQESHKLYDTTQLQYNVATMSICDWFNSVPVQEFRKGMLGPTRQSACSRCYTEEEFGGTSRRHKSNQKSVIFTKTNFSASYQQSPGYQHFNFSQQNNGAYDGMPIDLHIDLGNYCNLACKMCNPQASSAIASQYAQWGLIDNTKSIGTDWTKDSKVWYRVLDELANIKKLNNIHFMGGETLITKRFEDFVDFMIDRGRFDLNFSFVTNGTTFNENLINKLKQFNRVGIEVSIETLTEHNQYVRQGTDNQLVLANIKRYLAHCNNSNITLTVRPAVSALSIGYYPTLLRYCLENKLLVKSLIVSDPRYLDSRILPHTIKQEYLHRYHQLIADYNLEQYNTQDDYNESDPNQFSRIIRAQIDTCINLLESPEPDNSDELLKEMVTQCRRWDDVYGYDARALYPELTEILNNYGY
jgi:pyruvate-formate lyase-activating enzyme